MIATQFALAASTRFVKLHKIVGGVVSRTITVRVAVFVLPWQALIRKKKSARKPTSAPGRKGRVETTHISLSAILSRVPDALALQQQFAAEMML